MHKELLVLLRKFDVFELDFIKSNPKENNNITSYKKQPFHLVADSGDLRRQLGIVIGQDGAGHHGAGEAAGSSKGDLGGDEDERNVLLFAQQRQMEEIFQGIGVGSHDNQVGDTSVESLGGLVGTLLQQLVVQSLLHEVKDGDGQLGISEGEGFGVD